MVTSTEGILEVSLATVEKGKYCSVWIQRWHYISLLLTRINVMQFGMRSNSGPVLADKDWLGRCNKEATSAIAHELIPVRDVTYWCLRKNSRRNGHDIPLIYPKVSKYMFITLRYITLSADILIASRGPFTLFNLSIIERLVLFRDLANG